jgi:hypothetical protein
MKKLILTVILIAIFASSAKGENPNLFRKWECVPIKLIAGEYENGKWGSRELDDLDYRVLIVRKYVESDLKRCSYLKGQLGQYGVFEKSRGEHGACIPLVIECETANDWMICGNKWGGRGQSDGPFRLNMKTGRFIHLFAGNYTLVDPDSGLEGYPWLSDADIRATPYFEFGLCQPF